METNRKLMWEIPLLIPTTRSMRPSYIDRKNVAVQIQGSLFNVLREEQVTGEPAGAKRRRGSQTARGKRSDWSSNQQASFKHELIKKAVLNTFVF
ncbi:MAG: hypothetical protein K0Q87_291 [Neobacillus sp.]|nr:hypothetical protein [Neobacillus sp.]